MNEDHEDPRIADEECPPADDLDAPPDWEPMTEHDLHGKEVE